MGSRGRLAVYGLLVWIIPFAVAFALLAVRDNWRALFESVMAVTVAATVTALAFDHLRRIRSGQTMAGLVAGLVWMAVSIVIDLPLMLPPPVGMPLPDYLADIALTYLMIPVIATGLGAAFARAGHSMA